MGEVSILTRSEERVQLRASASVAAAAVFQSSPAPKSGCNFWQTVKETVDKGFNPHPLRRAGATRYSLGKGPKPSEVSILTRSEERVQQ